MFSIREEDDFLLENPTFSITCPEFIIPKDLGIGPASLSSLQVQGTTLNNNNKGKRKCISNERSKDVLMKKIVHRDVERQRRQAMANLYDSVRSVIPPELLKSRLSISNHIHEASNYIRYLQNNEWSIRRRELEQRLHKEYLLRSEYDGV
ncbi:unnamed protein product [Fraxinus pennsylvanica]|uniref:BHLH domain-containing protein n=1 Tax=Fraxinus pennsylvanica TaxID=56036 RepID=A0AAD2EBE5_9LAMI|nr:unnamed protein product [Fraxinus pennsylvanica]